jgi:hypothetical protein
VRHRGALSCHVASHCRPPWADQCVIPIAEPQPGRGHGCIGTRSAYDPPARAVSHGCPRTGTPASRGT